MSTAQTGLQKGYSRRSKSRGGAGRLVTVRTWFPATFVTSLMPMFDVDRYFCGCVGLVGIHRPELRPVCS
eukprot:5987728-Prymnesium_polylepis.1